MDSEILKYLLFIPLSVLLKYIESRYLSDVRKRKNLFEDIPNQSIHQCITSYKKFGAFDWKSGKSKYISFISKVAPLMLLTLSAVFLGLNAIITHYSNSYIQTNNFTELECFINSTFTSKSLFEREELINYLGSNDFLEKVVGLNLCLEFDMDVFFQRMINIKKQMGDDFYKCATYMAFFTPLFLLIKQLSRLDSFVFGIHKVGSPRWVGNETLANTLGQFCILFINSLQES